MLRQAFLFGALLVWSVSGDLFGDLNLFNEEPQFQGFAWERPQFSSRNAAGSLETLEKDREPLGPDYKDPSPQATEDKPLVAGTSDTKDKPVLNPKKENQRPKHRVNAVIPGGGGIIDIDAGAFPLFASPFGPEFDFPAALPGLDSPAGGGVLGFGGLFGIEEGKRWWKGENVCIEREESTDDDDGEKKEEKAEAEVENKNETESQESHREPNFFATSIRLSNCMESENKYECITRINNHGVVKTFTVRYRCCYGFKRTPESNGCTKEVDLKPVLQTLEDLKLDEFRGMIKSSGLDSTFESGNFTVFVPSDDAINDYNEILNDMNKVDLMRRRRALKHVLKSNDLVLSHTTEGFIELSDLQNEQTLKSEDDKKSTIRINFFPTHTYEKLVTANCARVKKGNVLADNGIVHIVDRVIPPASDNVEELIRNQPKLSIFRKALENTDILKHIKPNGHYTIFAATDEAFNKLDAIQRQKLLSGGGCASNILKHHIVAHTVCSLAIIDNATTHNVEGVLLNMERTVDDELIFEGKAKIIDADIIGTNGVIHLIDNLIIPVSGQYIGTVLKSHNFTKFQDIVQRAGLTEELDNFDNATVFVPSDAAFENPQTQKLLKEIGDDKEKLRNLVRYHIIDGQVQSTDMSNNMIIPTKDEGKDLRVNLYSTVPLFTNVINRATINCARLVHFDEKTCGSIVHEVNKVLVPPKESIFEIIQNNDKYSTLRELLKGTKVEQVLKENNRSITFLAPTDETFAGLDEKDRKMLLENKERAEEVLKNHVLTEVLCCSGVGPHTWGFNSFVPTLGNQRVEVGRIGSQVRFNRAVAISCDNLATNGILHTINKVLAPRKQAVATSFLLFDL